MESNPYAPPTAHVADPVANTHGLKYRSLWLMLVFFVIRLGLYYVIWFFRRRPGLNRLDSPRKLPMWPLLLTAAFVGGQFVLGLVAGFTLKPVPDLIGPVGSGILTLLQLVVGVTMIIQCFGIKDIIQDHATPPPDPRSLGRGFFFFGHGYGSSP